MPRGGARVGAGRKGRPKQLTIAGIEKKDPRPIGLRARDHAHLALAGYVRVLTDIKAPAAAVVSAATAVLDRAFGKPVESKVTMDLNAFGGYSNDDIRRLIDDVRAARGIGTVIDNDAPSPGNQNEPARMGEASGISPGSTPPADPPVPGANGKGGS